MEPWTCRRFGVLHRHRLKRKPSRPFCLDIYIDTCPRQEVRAFYQSQELGAVQLVSRDQTYQTLRPVEQPVGVIELSALACGKISSVFL